MSPLLPAERLTAAPRQIRAKGVEPCAFRYLRDMAIDGAFPAHQRNGIWHYYLSDLDKIIAAIQSRRMSSTARRAA